MPVASVDHVAVPAHHVRELIDFYSAIGLDTPTFHGVENSPLPVFSISCGQQKINFHLPTLWQSESFELRGPTATPGCGDFCFVWQGSEIALTQALASVGTNLIMGPVRMRGAAGWGASVYARDPDDNLVEFIFYDTDQLVSSVRQRLDV